MQSASSEPNWIYLLNYYTIAYYAIQMVGKVALPRHIIIMASCRVECHMDNVIYAAIEWKRDTGRLNILWKLGESNTESGLS